MPCRLPVVSRAKEHFKGVAEADQKPSSDPVKLSEEWLWHAEWKAFISSNYPVGLPNLCRLLILLLFSTWTSNCFIIRKNVRKHSIPASHGYYSSANCWWVACFTAKPSADSCVMEQKQLVRLAVILKCSPWNKTLFRLQLFVTFRFWPIQMFFGGALGFAST